MYLQEQPILDQDAHEELLRIHSLCRIVEAFLVSVAADKHRLG